MRKKLKLNFAQLEQNMELNGNILSSPVDLSSISGGSNIYEIMDYLGRFGFYFTQDSNGNYHSGSWQLMNDITIMGSTKVVNSNGSYNSFSDPIQAYNWMQDWQNNNSGGTTGGSSGGNQGGNSGGSPTPGTVSPKEILLSGLALTITTGEIPPAALVIAGLAVTAAGILWIYQNIESLRGFGDSSTWSYTYRPSSEDPINNPSPSIDPNNLPQGPVNDIWGVLSVLGLTTLQYIDQYNDFKNSLPPAIRDSMPHSDTLFQYNPGSYPYNSGSGH